MAKISGWEEIADFEGLRKHILADLRYPTPAQHKLETYGWVPTIFEQSERTFRRRNGEAFTRFGSWRNGASEADSLTAFYADIDNDNSDRPLVTMQDVAAKLDELGVRYFMYTSYSHTFAKPKFRVVIETDRPFTRADALQIAVYLNWTAFGQQADLSIYDPGDFLFAPPHHTITLEGMSGTAMLVDGMLSLQQTLQTTQPQSWSRYLAAKQPSAPRAGSVRAGSPAPTLDTSVRPEIGMANPKVFNPAWADLYRLKVVGGSHWETMRSLLGMVWAKTGGTLTFGEVLQIAREIDATDAGYFIQRHGEQKLHELVVYTVGLPVEEPASEWSPILDEEETGLIIKAKEAECGEGKTHDELKRMAHEKGRYVYVVDKIENIEKRKQEFYAEAGRGIAPKFFTREAHSKNDGLRVPVQLHRIREDLDKLPAGSAALVFVTQQGAMQMDWSRWSDFEVILDEVPDVFSVYKIKVKNHAAVLRHYVRTDGEDGNCYRLALTSAGEELARTNDIDDYDAVHHGLCVMMNKPNTLVWVKKKGWDGSAEGGKLEFFAITSPLNLKPFSAVWMLGDELTKSVTAKVWAQKWGVQFEPVQFAKRARIIPTKDRVSITYFSDHRDSSLTRFKEGDLPLPAITEWIRGEAGSTPVLWTANEKLKERSALDLTDYITPKSHGRNDLQHYTRVAWLAAMKASKFEIGTLREVCGMSAQELTDWREYNTLYQFVMRSILRDYGSAVPVSIYVFSRRQAEYLQSRLGGTIRKAQGVIEDQPVRALDQDGAMSARERQKVKYYREKMVAAGVEDVRLLPKSEKLSERELRLINLTFARIGTQGTAPERLAA